MHHIIALFGVLIESSVRVKVLSLLVTLPYLLYLISFKSKRTISYMVVTALFFTLQSSSMLFTFILFLGFAGLFYLMLMQLEYVKNNVYIFALVQSVIYITFGLLNNERITVFSTIFNIIGFLIVNFLFLKKRNRKREN